MGILFEEGVGPQKMRDLRKMHPEKYLSQRATELIKDKWWRLNHLYKILDKDDNIVRFQPNTEQEYVHRNRTDKFIILKARQLGMTTYSLIDGLDSCIFTPNFRMGVIAHQLDAMFGIFEIVKRAWQYFPENLKKMCGQVRVTRTSITFPNGSKLSVALSFRSGTLSRLHVSELGKMARKFPDRAKEVITGSFPTAQKGVISIESTAEGVGGIFHNLWLGSPDNGFKKFFFHWKDHSEYTAPKRKISVRFLNLQRRNKLTAEQISWYYGMYKDMDEEVFQEYPLNAEMAFLQSGNAVFNSEDLFISCQPQEPEEGRWYVIGGDPASGESVGSDPDKCSLDVLDWETGNQVYHWAGIEKPDQFAFRLFNVSRKYNNAIIGCERNNHGILTISKLEEMKANQHVTRSYSRRRQKHIDKWGWETNKVTKPLVIDELEEDIRKENIGIAYQHTIDELLSFEEKDNGKTGAVDGCHDDAVMSLAIANRMRKEHPPINKITTKKRPEDTPGTFLYEVKKHTKTVKKTIMVGS